MAVLHDHPQANRYRKLDDRGEAHPESSTGPALIARTCSDRSRRPRPLDACGYWPNKVVELGLVSKACHTRRCGSGSKKHPQTLAKTAMVHLPR